MRSKKILCAGAAVLLAGTVSGCSVKVGTNAEPDLGTIVAEPEAPGYDKGLEVTYGEFKREYDYAVKGAGIEDDTDPSYSDACKTQRSTIITYLINEKIILKKANEMGLGTLTEEEMSEVEKEYNSLIDEQVKIYGDNADYGTVEASSVSDDDKTERGNKEFDDFLAGCNLTRDDLLTWQKNSAVTDKLIAEIGKSVDYSEAEKNYTEYQKQIETLYNESVLQYEQNGFSSVWVPEGSRMIKHILLGFDEDTQDLIKSDRSKGDDEAADKLREEKAAELQDKIEEVQKKLDAGEDFNTLLMTYSSDAASSSANPDGYLVVPNGQTYMKEFQAAAFVPEKIGDRTVCVTDYGVHIMIYAGDAKVSEEDKKSFTDYLYDQLVNAAFSEKMDEWRAEYNYKIDYAALRLDEPAESSDSSN